MPTPEVSWIPLTSPGFLYESPYSVHHHECTLDYSPVGGATEKETLPEIYILVFHALASREV